MLLNSRQKKTAKHHAISTALALGLTAFATVSAQAVSSGTDMFGNFITSSTLDPSIPTNQFFDISGTPQASVLAQGDDTAANAALGFAFPFYGTEFTSLTFATNGYISTLASDGGPDLSNDTSPQVPSTGGGARIYPHHDDTEAVIYGGFFGAAVNPLGTDAYIAQWNACHFACTPGPDLTIQYNVFLLRDGTIIIAHNLAGAEGGSGATIGIQNDGGTDGFFYSANEAGSITDGLTVVITPPRNSGISADMTIMAAEAGLTLANASAANVQSHAINALGGTDGASTFGLATGTTSADTKRWWFGATGRYLTGDIGSTLKARFGGFQFGMDFGFNDSTLYGVAVGAGVARTELGPATASTSHASISPYFAHRLNAWTISGSAGYVYTRYRDIDTNLPMLNNITATGHRVQAGLTATGFYDLNSDWVVSPQVAVSGGFERIDNWSNDDFGATVDDVSFVSGSATAKFIRDLPSNSGSKKVWLKAGIDGSATSADDDVALFGTSYNPSRIGATAGIGLDYKQGDLTINSSVEANGVFSDITTITAKVKVIQRF